MNNYYEESFEHLEMYQRLIQYWNFLFDKRNEIFVLDNMNFNSKIYSEILKISEILALHSIEPGYTSPDASSEMNALIKNLELARLNKHSPHRKKVNEELVNKAGVGCGNGTSNVMFAVMASISKLNKSIYKRANSSPEILLVLPNYTVYAAQASHMKPSVKTKFITAKQENGFLPTLEDVKNAVTPHTIAIVITYPNNPAQSTYEGERLKELKGIVSYCQENEIFLVVDNIYQDLIYPKTRQFEEVFAHTNSLDFIIKVYGQSKDTPFFSGYRTGYWFGDPIICNTFRYQISATENSLNTVTLCLFGFSLLFKACQINNKEITLEDAKMFEHGIFGWSQLLKAPELLDRILCSNIKHVYDTRIKESNQKQEEAVKLVKTYASKSKVFSNFQNENIGNVALLRINPDCFSGTDAKLYEYLIQELKIGVLPGNVFGLPHKQREAWFRITLIHEKSSTILKYLQKIEEHFIKNIG